MPWPHPVQCVLSCFQAELWLWKKGKRKNLERCFDKEVSPISRRQFIGHLWPGNNIYWWFSHRITRRTFNNRLAFKFLLACTTHVKYRLACPTRITCNNRLAWYVWLHNVIAHFFCTTQLFSEAMIPNAPFRNQQLYHGLSWTLNSSHQRCSPIDGLRIHFCSVFKQQLNQVFLTRMAGVMQCSPLEIISSIDVSSTNQNNMMD